MLREHAPMPKMTFYAQISTDEDHQEHSLAAKSVPPAPDTLQSKPPELTHQEGDED